VNTKSHGQSRSTEGDTLVRVARTIGSALGAIAAKINTLPKTARKRRKSLKSRIAKQAKTVSVTKARSKRRS
jgi:hypothetical protein